ncbi:hypothetical protein TanjilG_12269 [Lupinus angustifolius]|uniref:Cytochrome b5 heme-binding domain-containing protein n=1 Tax=Lupinus angustifolius TaxID=3871 RepID=A0A1J7GCB4_LUPAN|nr:hypothetical protein TanjilG_12269 [Lupinus angustifolius]
MYLLKFSYCLRTEKAEEEKTRVLQCYDVNVYDLTSFIEDHPGGAEVLLAATGKDGTSDYEAAGHSDYAIEMMKKYYIGKIDTTNVPQTRIYTPPEQDQYSAYMSTEFMIKFLQYLFPILILGLAFGVRYYTKKE